MYEIIDLATLETYERVRAFQALKSKELTNV